MAFNTAHFARMPEAKKPHTLFKRPFVHAGTMMHGDIVPAYCKLCSPGEVISEPIIGNIRMSTPVGPLYSSIKVAFNAFFIPLRLVWEHTKEFFGENTQTAGPQTIDYKIPSHPLNARDTTISKVSVHSVSHYLGKPLFKGNTIDSGVYTDQHNVSVLKERAYWLTVSEWYRHEQVMNPVLLNKSDSGSIGTLDGVALGFSSPCMKCLKDFDYFTTMTRSPQYGPDVVLPLGANAPIVVDSTYHQLGGDLGFGYTVAETNVDFKVGLTPTSSGTNVQAGNVAGTPSYPFTRTNLVADLASATSASIDELYLAMAAQAWYHNANYGSKYFEMLQIHYGVYNPDLVLQRPEHIGEAKRYISVQQVLATAESTSGGVTKPIGTPGANSSTDLNIKFPRYSVGEWGFYLVLMNTYHERYYPAGVQREDLYSEMFDFFFPEFSNIGDMGVKVIEAFYTSGTDPEKIIGFQEAWSEMRYSPNKLSGLLDPYAESGVNSSANSLKQWVLAEKWANAPTFSKQFLLEDRSAIQDALTTGANGPDYVFYLYFDETVLSEVPLFSRPGLPGRGRGL